MCLESYDHIADAISHAPLDNILTLSLNFVGVIN